MSGNGTRCLAWVAVAAGLVPDDFTLATGGGRRTVHVVRDDAGLVVAASVDMGVPVHGDADLDAAVDGRAYVGDAVSMGNPHLVLFVDEPAAVPLAVHGPVLEHDPRFPQRTNVHFAVVDGPDRVRIVTWERGAGATLSCGTGASASAAVARRRGLVGDTVTVAVPGGELRATFTADGTVGAGRTGGPRGHDPRPVPAWRPPSPGARRRPPQRAPTRRDGPWPGPRAGRGTVSSPGRSRRRLTATEVDLGVVRQRAVIVGVAVGSASSDDVEAGLDELALLVDTAGADAVARVVAAPGDPRPGTYLGAGKLEELREIAVGVDADVVVFDDELTPAQQLNLEKVLGRDGVDRAAVILDIFAQNAHSREGKAQVELAQLRYRLPRLRGRGTQLVAAGAGIGTRGPGETQLEVDRRRIVRRIAKLERDLTELGRTGDPAQGAAALEQSHVALVGYTNAGKSTLLNRLTGAAVLVENRLFATLDPTIRQLRLPGGETVVLTDTVGFVRKLPHQLVEAFRSTLEELVERRPAGARRRRLGGRARAADRGGPTRCCGDRRRRRARAHRRSTRSTPPSRRPRLASLRPHPGAVAVSARTGEGMDELLRQAIADRLRSAARRRRARGAARPR